MRHDHGAPDQSAEDARQLRQAIPHVYEGFGSLHRNAMRDGAIPSRLKEAMALAISVVNGCDGCISFHARAAVRHGASAEEVAEALGVAILLSGGPGTVHAPKAWRAFLDFQRAEAT